MESVGRAAALVGSPIGVLTVLLLFGLAGRLSSRLRRRAQLATAVGAALFLIFAFSPLAEVLIWGLERDYRPLRDPLQSASVPYVVVLGGAGEELSEFPVSNALSDETTGRLVEGLRLYRLVPGTKIVVSGGAKRDGQAVVASLMGELLRQSGVPPEDVLIEGQSRDTYENLLEVRTVVGGRPFLLVTSACDLRRAMAVAHRLHMQAQPAPARFWSAHHLKPDVDTRRFLVGLAKASAHPSLERLGRLQWAYHEYIGYLWYRMTGRI
jgi:uncharacterized SAM-binding protein YcdF (DUF218 family)